MMLTTFGAPPLRLDDYLGSTLLYFRLHEFMDSAGVFVSQLLRLKAAGLLLEDRLPALRRRPSPLSRSSRNMAPASVARQRNEGSRGQGLSLEP